MKIMYVDDSLRGHREGYIRALCSISGDSVVMIPGKIEGLPNKQYIYSKSNYHKKRNIIEYIRWIREIAGVAKREQIDIIHFLCGDSLYRYFGIALSGLRHKFVVTFHHMLFDRVRTISIKNIFRKAAYGIVHTDYLKDELLKRGVNNCERIEYPYFGIQKQEDARVAKSYFSIPNDKTCLMVLGGTQYYKGIDILLEALKSVKSPFVLCITGVVRDFDENYIRVNTEAYKRNVVLHLSRLSIEEYNTALVAADIIILPYRKSFDGASGPMIDGVWNRKYIIGADHGSMGKIINTYELGTTFASEDAEDLAHKVEYVLQNGMGWSDKAEAYRNCLDPERFIESYFNIYMRIIQGDR